MIDEVSEKLPEFMMLEKEIEELIKRRKKYENSEEYKNPNAQEDYPTEFYNQPEGSRSDKKYISLRQNYDGKRILSHFIATLNGVIIRLKSCVKITTFKKEEVSSFLDGIKEIEPRVTNQMQKRLLKIYLDKQERKFCLLKNQPSYEKFIKEELKEARTQLLNYLIE